VVAGEAKDSGPDVRREDPAGRRRGRSRAPPGDVAVRRIHAHHGSRIRCSTGRGRPDRKPLELVLLTVPLAVIAIILVPFYLHSRRRRQALPLAVGADRRTRTQVQRAIRAGHTADRRIDALVRDLREYHHRSRWQALVPGAVALAVGLLLIGLFDHPVLRVVTAFAIVLVVAALWRVWLMYRRLAHYRGLVDR